MKRMYVTLFVLFGIIFWAGTILGQQSKSTSDVDKVKLREEIHRRILDKMLRGIGSDQDMFSDMEEMMNQMMNESMSGFQSFDSGASQNFQMEWLESRTGRTLLVTPQTKDQELDINISNGFIIIKGKSEHKSQSGSSYSQFSNSLNVPGDCDPGKVKMDQKDGKILIYFPFISSIPKTPKPQNKRTPLPPSEGDVQI